MRGAAAKGIAAMSTPGVNDALLAAIDDPSVAAGALKAIGKRGVPGAGSKIVGLARYGKTSSVRKEAWSALVSTATAKDMDKMMMALMAIRDSGEKKHAAASIKEFTTRAHERIVPAAAGTRREPVIPCGGCSAWSS